MKTGLSGARWKAYQSSQLDLKECQCIYRPFQAIHGLNIKSRERRRKGDPSPSLAINWVNKNVSGVLEESGSFYRTLNNKIIPKIK